MSSNEEDLRARYMKAMREADNDKSKIRLLEAEVFALRRQVAQLIDILARLQRGHRDDDDDTD